MTSPARALLSALLLTGTLTPALPSPALAQTAPGTADPTTPAPTPAEPTPVVTPSAPTDTSAQTTPPPAMQLNGIPAKPVSAGQTSPPTPTPAALPAPDLVTPQVNVSDDMPEIAPSTAAPAVKAPALVPEPKITAPLLINVAAGWPAVVDGKVTTVPFNRTLTIPGERVKAIRERGGITASLDADLKTFIAGLPVKPQDAAFENLWDGWALVQRNGLTIDAAKTRANVLAALKDPRGVKADVVVTGQTAPARTLDFFTSKGITQHLGTGETNYYGSSDARVTNIHTGARHFQDTLVDGKVVSFNQIVGPVSLRSGFVTGLVIAGERTADGVGGGICQVSTTVFRALYAAGLPIVQRQNHSYQVHYYDPQGLDATIYQPSLDLRFANDTGGTLWFQTDWDDAASRLTVSVFGKARDFTVEIGKPQTLSSTPSPADRMIPDATLAAGTRKQVDWAAPGAVVQVTRSFKRGDKVLRQDTLKSSYRPWPNIYLVGTKK